MDVQWCFQLAVLDYRLDQKHKVNYAFFNINHTNSILRCLPYAYIQEVSVYCIVAGRASLFFMPSIMNVCASILYHTNVKSYILVPCTIYLYISKKDH